MKSLSHCIKLGFTPYNREAGLCTCTHANSQLDLSFCFYFAIFVMNFFKLYVCRITFSFEGFVGAPKWTFTSPKP